MPESARAFVAPRHTAANLERAGLRPRAEWVALRTRIAGLAWEVFTRSGRHHDVIARSPAGVAVEYILRPDVPDNYGQLVLRFEGQWFCSRSWDDARQVARDLAAALGVMAPAFRVSELHACVDVPEEVPQALDRRRWAGSGGNYMRAFDTGKRWNGQKGVTSWSTARQGAKKDRIADVILYDKTADVRDKKLHHYAALWHRLGIPIDQPVTRLEARGGLDLLRRCGIEGMDDVDRETVATFWRHIVGGETRDALNRPIYWPGYVRLLTYREGRNPNRRPERQAVSPLWRHLRSAAARTPRAAPVPARRLAVVTDDRIKAAAGNLAAAVRSANLAHHAEGLAWLERSVIATARAATVDDNRRAAALLREMAAMLEAGAPPAASLDEHFRLELRKRLDSIAEGPGWALPWAAGDPPPVDLVAEAGDAGDAVPLSLLAADAAAAPIRPEVRPEA